jgi:anhydro-N-acetylmuramic acid kinase
LGREWFEEQFRPVLDRMTPLPDRMRTVAEHIASIAGGAIDRACARHVFVTGGGAHHALLIERLRASTRAQVEIPGYEVVDFKEAIVFAFLGLLRWRGEANALCSVTGARADSIGGAVHLPN